MKRKTLRFRMGCSWMRKGYCHAFDHILPAEKIHFFCEPFWRVARLFLCTVEIMSEEVMKRVMFGTCHQIASQAAAQTAWTLPVHPLRC